MLDEVLYISLQSTPKCFIQSNDFNRTFVMPHIAPINTSSEIVLKNPNKSENQAIRW